MSKWDDFLREFRRLTGGCAEATGIAQARTHLTQGLHAVTIATSALSGSSSAPARRLREALQRYSAPARSVSSGLSTLNGVCADASAVARIIAAARTLNDSDALRRDPEAHAAAFGQLFVGAGQLASHLPSPANAYAEFLQGAGVFFVNMQRLMDPASSHTPGGRAMQQALDEIDGQYTTQQGM